MHCNIIVYTYVLKQLIIHLLGDRYSYTLQVVHNSRPRSRNYSFVYCCIVKSIICSRAAKPGRSE